MSENIKENVCKYEKPNEEQLDMIKAVKTKHCEKIIKLKKLLPLIVLALVFAVIIFGSVLGAVHNSKMNEVSRGSYIGMQDKSLWVCGRRVYYLSYGELYCCQYNSFQVAKSTAKQCSSSVIVSRHEPTANFTQPKLFATAMTIISVFFALCVFLIVYIEILKKKLYNYLFSLQFNIKISNKMKELEEKRNLGLYDNATYKKLKRELIKPYLQIKD